MAVAGGSPQWKLLEDALREVLQGKLGALAAGVGLDEAALRDQARAGESEILAPLSTAWERWNAAMAELAELESAFQGSSLTRMRRWLGRLRRSTPRGMAEGLSVATALLFAIFLIAYFFTGRLGVPSVVNASIASASISALVFFVGRFLSLLVEVGPSAAELREAGSEAARSERRYEGRLKDAVSAWVRSRINVTEGLSYDTRLGFKDASGLAEVDEGGREVPTEARRKLAAMIELMPGGAIGLAGTRGAGKSTLMHSICDSGKADKGILGVVVDAPVQYEAREFILHLFAKLCEEEIGKKRAAALRSWRPYDPTAVGARRLPYHPLLGPAMVVLGGLLVASAVDVSIGAVPGSAVIGVLLTFVGYVLGLNSLIRDGARVRGLFGVGGSGDANPEGEEPEDDLPTIAERRLRQIWFQQSFSSGWSGSLKVPIGLEGGVEASAELSEQQLSLPDIVDLLHGFIELASSEREVRIGIDELDKMADRDAHRFLNEIKVIFRVPGCFFFVSISEDAMSMFERRGLPIRDVFDSSFDAVLHVPHLRFEQSRELLDRRIVDLPVSFAALLYCISGGLPRDLIRASRDLVALPTGTPLAAAAKAHVGTALAAKVAATKVQARRLSFAGHVTMLIRWLELLSASDWEPEILLDACRGFEPRYREELRALPTGRAREEDEGLLQDLAIQVVAFAYYAATLLQLFGQMRGEESIEAALRPGNEALAPVDLLAAASQEFAIDLSSAWEMLSRLRVDLGLEPLPFPRLYLDDPDAVSA